MTQVRSAIHVRTGQRAPAEAVDEWLRRTVEAVVCLADPYEACAHLLSSYETVPDLALVGLDLLRTDELPLLTYLRQTWPRTVIVTYGHAAADRAMELLPLAIGFHGEPRLRELLATSPADIVRQVCERAAAFNALAPVPRVSPAAPAAPAAVSIPPHQERAAAAHPSPPLSNVSPYPPDTDSQPPLLTAQELSALLDDGEP